MENKRKITEEKVWMKYYSDEAKSAELPRCKAFDYIIQQNKDRLDAPALHYYGADISFRSLIRRVDEIAASFTALGVKAGDIVSFLSVAIPETIESVYALNKIGAAANTIDPRMDVASIQRMISASGSKILVVLDIAFPKVRPIMSKISQEKIVVQSAATSLPPVKKFLKSVTTKTDVSYSDTVINWTSFIRGGQGSPLCGGTLSGGCIGGDHLYGRYYWPAQGRDDHQRFHERCRHELHPLCGPS